MKRKSLEVSSCPIARSLDVMGDIWSILILREAFMGSRRFGEFQETLGLARNILTTRLRKLATHGLLQIVPASDGSAYREYILTPKGRSAYPILAALRQWGEDHSEAPHPSYDAVDRKSGQKLAPLRLRTTRGKEVKAQDIILVRR